MCRLNRCLGTGLFIIAMVLSATGQKPATAGQNAALQYWQAFALMQDTDISGPDAKQLDGIVDGTQPWDEAKFGPLLDANHMALATMHRATKLPYCDWGLDPRMDPGVPMGHIAKARALARLNALAGIRQAAQGHVPLAVDTWLDGFRFAQHAGEDGTMIGVLLADVGISAQLHALTRMVGSKNENLDDDTLARIEKALRGLPPYVFDWSRPMLTERGSGEFIVGMVRSNASLADFQEIYGEKMSQAELDEVRASTAARSDQEFNSVYSQAADALQLPYLSAKPKLEQIQASIPSTTKLVQTTVPNLVRYNENRAQLEAERAGLLALVVLRRAGLKDVPTGASLARRQIPNDPYSGQPFQIVKNAQGLQIQSVGKDSKGSPLVYQLTQ